MLQPDLYSWNLSSNCYKAVTSSNILFWLDVNALASVDIVDTQAY